MAKIVVAGGGICGSAAALLLARDGHDVVVLDRDPGPFPESVEAAWASWERRSISQFRLAHLMLARGTGILKAELPDVVDRMVACGALRFNGVTAGLAATGGSPLPDDDRFEVVTGRRPFLEWVLSGSAANEPRVEFRRGAAIGGLVAGASVLTGVPHVIGVRLESGEIIDADLVVDATGRRSPTPNWLAELGSRPPAEHAEDSGFAYYGRFYRSADGSLPAMLAPPLSPLGSFSVLTLPSDNGTWSTIIYGSSDDAPLRRLRNPAVFDAVLAACPAHAHWLEGERINELVSMMGVVDRDRRYVVDGQPVVTGVASIADAWACTNPSLGRGMSIGLLHTTLLRDVIRNHLDDPLQLALAFDAVTAEQAEPWHAATRQIDRARLAEMRSLTEGRQPEPDPTNDIGNALATASLYDEVVLRGLSEVQGCLALADEVLAREGFFERLLRVAGEHPPLTIPGPNRQELLELLS